MAGTPSSLAIDPAPSAVASGGGLDRCEQLSRQFDAVLLAGTGACTSKDDCGSYSAGVGQNCGGATDTATAAKLRAITTEFRAAGCGHTVHCGPRQVFGIECRNGLCAEINEQRGGPPR